MTALQHYVQGIDLALQRGWPDFTSVRNAATQASRQIIRGTESIRRLRRLAEALRDTGCTAAANRIGHGTQPDEVYRGSPSFNL
jgi:hypothetical protein